MPAEATSTTETVDVVIVGTGPCGLAAARTLAADRPELTVLVVDAGRDLGPTPGGNVRNLPVAERTEVYSQLRRPGEREMGPPGTRPIAARPGTHLFRPDDQSGDDQADMPAAAYSTNVGGMGAHWTCACPRPGDSEVIDFIPADEMDGAIAAAETALHVTTSAFTATPASTAVLDALLKCFPSDRYERTPGPMPLACRPQPGRLPEWAGSLSVLGPTPESAEIRAETLCVRLSQHGEHSWDVELRDLPSARTYPVRARVVLVAADAFRTPQLLWASNIRPQALGRYLNDQPQIVAPAYVNVPQQPETPDSTPTAVVEDARDSLTGVCWVPFSDDRPFHGQVMQLDTSPVAIAGTDGTDGRPVVGLGWFTAKELRPEDRLVFDDTDLDEAGMPSIRVEYSLSDRDRETVAAAVVEIRRVAAELGQLVPGTEPLLLPAGSSLHYQGTVRMGAEDDGTSVCDTFGQVWSTPGLFVAGNGVIPTATACNPTLTSVALAIRSAWRIIEILDATDD